MNSRDKRQETRDKGYALDVRRAIPGERQETRDKRQGEHAERSARNTLRE
ncbi:MAG: hypothetical protein LBL21_00150 [Rickettsiales bacterium]|nr:hypothetical protein [Rickettsiales bacterium]